MNSGFPSPVPRPASFFRVGVYRFLAILTLPVLLLLGATCILIMYHLADIEKLAADTNEKRLPGILAAQRTLINIENMRRNVAMIYNAQDPRLRRNALIDALALASESVFEPDSGFIDYARTAEPLIRSLSEAKSRSDEAADSLHNEELRFSNANGRLLLRAGLPDVPHMAHNARYLSSDTDIAQDAAHSEHIQELLFPLQTLCREVPSDDPALRDDCDRFKSSWNALTAAWRQYVNADNGARALWRELDELLRKLSDDASSVEAELTYRAMEHIRTEARRARTAFFMASLLLIGVLIVFVAAVHRSILAPIALASRDLRKIRYGQPTNSIPPVRLRELQDLLDLLPSLSRHLAELSERSGQLEKEKDRYANLSLRDALTGVYNRRSFDEQLSRDGRKVSLSLLMLDVDLFKLYNDTFGHQAGDAALAAVAHAMEQSLLRGTDKVFRYGGEEFAVLLPNATEKAARAVAERIQRNVRALALPHPASSVAPVLTVSIGVALRTPDDKADDTELITRADKALYRAKSSGRDRVCLYRPEDGPTARP